MWIRVSKIFQKGSLMVEVKYFVYCHFYFFSLSGKFFPFFKFARNWFYSCQPGYVWGYSSSGSSDGYYQYPSWSSYIIFPFLILGNKITGHWFPISTNRLQSWMVRKFSRKNYGGYSVTGGRCRYSLWDFKFEHAVKYSSRMWVFYWFWKESIL